MIQVNGVQVKANQVWVTKNNRLALIVDVPEFKDKLGMLWHDDIDKTLTVSEILSRLQSLSVVTTSDFLLMASKSVYGRDN